MITAVRLQKCNPKKGFMLRTYVSANSETRYNSGEGDIPSGWRIVSDQDEIAELKERLQFEFKVVDDMGALRELVQLEMEAEARIGGAPVRAAIHEPKESGVAKKRDLSPISLDEGAGGDDEDDFGVVEPSKVAKQKKPPAVSKRKKSY